MDTGRTPARRLRIFLRDFRMIDAHVGLADGQALAPYFSHRRNYVNLRAVRWATTGEEIAHAVLKVQQILWAAAPDGDVPLTTASAPPRARLVEFHLDGGLLVQGGLILSTQQRLGDYLETAGPFLPIVDAQLLRSGRPPRQVNVQLGDIVLNQDGVQAVWEVTDQLRAVPDPETAEPLQPTPVPDNNEVQT
jgi:hypothetical protein